MDLLIQQLALPVPPGDDRRGQRYVLFASNKRFIGETVRWQSGIL